MTDERRKKIEYYLVRAALCVGVFLVTLALWWGVKPLIGEIRNGVIAQGITVFVIALCLAFVAYMGMTKRLKTSHLLWVLFVVAYAVRVGYMLYTPAATRQQDTFTSHFDGHEAYAWTIFSTGKLPSTNVYQFYHPPLNALAQAGFMKFINGITGVVAAIFGGKESLFEAFAQGRPDYIDPERYYLYSSCQILSVLYSFFTAIMLVKIVRLFGFSKKTELLLSIFVLFYPRQIQFAGMLNNDGLAYLLATLALYFALKWQKGSKAWGWILGCAASVGLGMMTKLSMATVCMPIAGLFIYEFVRTLQKKENGLPLWKCIAQYGGFLCLCAPLGLWFQVYASQKFGQEFGFVFSNLNHKLYTGDHSFFGRFFFTFELSEYFGSIYCRPFEGHFNLFNYALRSSIFGEFKYWQGEGFAITAIFAAYAAAALLFVSLVWIVVQCVRSRKSEQPLWRRSGISLPDFLFVFLLVQSQALSEIYFYISMPYGCTMDFRYIMPLILGMALLWGYTRQCLEAQGGRVSLALNRLTLIAVGALLVSSTLFYCVCI